MSDSIALCYPYGKPILSGVIKQQPEDFIVNEQLGFITTGSGEHLFLYVEKRSLTTMELIEQLAKVAGISARLIGYSGLKDKHAVTRQWVSLHLPGAKEKPEIPDTEHYKTLQSDWHDKKIRVGVHKANQFEITIRNVKGQSEELENIIDLIRVHGFANYFGEQRFGRQQDNVAQALRTLNNRHKLKRLSRNKKSLYLSALRSELFNQILSNRIQQGIWMEPVEGDVFMLAGRQSIFSEELSEEILQRYKELDIHCALSMAGTGETKISHQASEIEQEVLQQNSEIHQTLIDLNIPRALRSNRALVTDFIIESDIETHIMVIKVELERGVYLTTLLQHFINVDAPSYPYHQ